MYLVYIYKRILGTYLYAVYLVYIYKRYILGTYLLYLAYIYMQCTWHIFINVYWPLGTYLYAVNFSNIYKHVLGELGSISGYIFLYSVLFYSTY